MQRPVQRPVTPVTLSDVYKVIDAAIAKHERDRGRRTVQLFRFAEKQPTSRGSGKYGAGNLRPPMPNPAQATSPSLHAPASNQAGAVRPKNTEFSFAASKFADRLPASFGIDPRHKLTQPLDPDERAELILKILGLDDGLRPEELERADDQALVGLSDLWHKMAEKDAPTPKQILRRMREASHQPPPDENGNVPKCSPYLRDGLPSGSDPSSMASVDDRPMPAESAVVDRNNQPVRPPNTEPRARKFSERPLPRGGMTPGRRVQLLNATSAGKTALARLGL